MAYGKVEATFWNDPLLRQSTEPVRVLLLYLLTNVHKNRLGLYVLPTAYAADDLQWEPAKVLEARAALQSLGRIKYDEAQRCVFLRRFLKHNKLENHKVVTGAISQLAGLPDTHLLRDLLVALEAYHLAHYVPLEEEVRNRIANRIDRVAQPYLPGMAGVEGGEAPPADPNLLGTDLLHGLGADGKAPPTPQTPPNSSPPEKLNTVLNTVEPSKPSLNQALTLTKNKYTGRLPGGWEQGFEEFWSAYPHKVGKKAAVKAYQARLREGAKHAEIMAGLKRYLAYKAATGERHHNPATFLGPNEWWKEPWVVPEVKALGKKGPGLDPAEQAHLADFNRRFAGKVPDMRPRAKVPEPVGDILKRMSGKGGEGEDPSGK